MPGAFDPLSRLSFRRLLLSILLVLLWAKALNPQAVWLGIAMLSGGFALIASGIAMLCREPLLGPNLNRWDEATALAGLHFLARALT
jgi:peptidoglycan biosynthesis protein MviN/MurJ (putative lipid II flippase)